GLNVPRAPVVHQHDTKDMILSTVDGNGLTKRIAGANEESRFQFEVQAHARTVNRAMCVRRLRLTTRSFHLRAANDNGTRAAVISDWQPFPVWHERVVWAAQHRSDIVSVMIGG